VRERERERERERVLTFWLRDALVGVEEERQRQQGGGWRFLQIRASGRMSIYLKLRDTPSL
jgi:hypothetical protein